MKICYANLEGVWLNENGEFRKGHHAYIEKENCAFCGSNYLANKHSLSVYCSQNCSKKVDLKDQRFGRLEVKEFSHVKNEKTYWKCKCDCGNTKLILGSNLTGKITTSCGCLQKEKTAEMGRAQRGRISTTRLDLTGQKFGRLEVKGLASIIDGHTYWKCLCDCGNTKTAYGTSLKNGDLQSCGCLAIEKSTERIKKLHKMGKDSAHWNPNLTDEDRIKRRHIPGYGEYPQKVYTVDDFICQCCNATRETHKNLYFNAHHIESYGSNPELRLEVSNGITLCEKCHRLFHHQYGQGNNTRAQFIEFLKDTTPLRRNKRIGEK